MKVDGQSTLFYDIFGEQRFEEARVKREREGGWLGLFGKEKLTIDAGAGDDWITVKKTGDDEYTVSVNGQKFKLTKEELENLEIKGGSGDDIIQVDASVDVDIKVDGGSGRDIILNQADGTTIDGGSGDDLIVSTGDHCDIAGGSGRDKIKVRGDDNEVTGGDRDVWDFWSFFFNREQDEVIVEGDGNDVR